MFTVLVVAAPIMFVLLTTMAILSFAPVDEESEADQRARINELNEQGDGGQIILFRPAAPAHKDSSADEIVAHLESELRQRQESVRKIVNE